MFFSSLPILAIVVPCYKEEEVLPETNERLLNLLKIMGGGKNVSPKSFILYVNDGSSDKTWDIITDLHKQSANVCGVNLAKNVGHQNALIAGLATVKDICDIAITVDADLQDDLNAIPRMVAAYKEGNDIVYGVRKERKTDTFFKRNSALLFYRLMKKMGVNSVYNHADYRLMSRRAIEHLCKFRERNLFVRGMVPLIGYKTSCVYYNRAERFAGESKYPLSKMLNFAIDGITSFSVKPVRMVFFVGVFFIVIALLVTGWSLFSYFGGTTVPGWASLMMSLYLIGGMVLVGLGIVGEYVGKIYMEVKDRPRYNIETVLLHSDEIC